MDEKIKLKIKQIDKEQLELATSNNLIILYGEEFGYEAQQSDLIYSFINNSLSSVPMAELEILAWFESDTINNKVDATSGNFYFNSATGEILALELNHYDGFCLAVIVNKAPGDIAKFVQSYGMHYTNNSLIRKLRIKNLL